ncbi:10226_t:CDS:10 [Paraglomus brasilianum]|uniref:DNA topoisomerase I n=1 Tax=Paraglomus brasilianum TaxID=144538 RepID=A0A9N9B1B9_9GLOM|nr:10226_t:CDS:10 [Paraglomus brasilianum]
MPSSDDDVPLAARKNRKAATRKQPSRVTPKKAATKNNKTQTKRKRVDSDSEFEIKSSSAKANSSKTNGTSKKAGPLQKKNKKRNNESDDDFVPNGIKVEKDIDGDVIMKDVKVKGIEKEESEDDIPLAKLTIYKKRNSKASYTYLCISPIIKWWEQENAENDGSAKWQTLGHNGVYFPPEYQPHGVKMKYKNKEIYLTPEAEEVATFYAAMLDTDYVKKEKFRANFFRDWLAVLKNSKENPKIESLEKCDFTPIYEYLQREKERKKSMSKEEKQLLKQEKLALEEKYGYCKLDGRTEKVGNFRIEPPNLFRGRGDHPKSGSLKKRVLPEEVTINIGKNSRIPPPPPGHAWGNVVHDNTVTWLATWKENVNESVKYVFLAATSSLKGQSDLKKFEKARELKKYVSKIRSDYKRDLKDKYMAIRQRATAMYLIDRFALRAGNEKNDAKEADTVGCCSLRCEHVTLEPPKAVIFDFLGKDSIRYYNKVEVEDQVFKNLRLFTRSPKEPKHPLFDRLNTSLLNKHLQTYMDGLTAKVFRTYNASYVFQKELDANTPIDGSIHDKILAYNRANRQVAVLCNHQRSVSKAHENQMGRIKDKIRALKYQKMKLKKTILTIDPKQKKKRPDLLQDESDLEEDWIIEYEKQLIEKEREKVRTKFEKDNEKLIADGKKPRSDKELDSLLKEVGEKAKQLSKERKTGKVEPKRGQTLEKLEANIVKLDERINAAKIAMVDKDENKETALSTSKINYIDPRISAAWCYKHKVPIDKIFNKSLREKFKWAMDISPDWEF